MVISSGSLIRREGVEVAGLPRRDFFIDFVDYEQCLRLRRHGFQIAVVNDSTLEHAESEHQQHSIFLGAKDPGQITLRGANTIWRATKFLRSGSAISELATKAFVFYPLASSMLLAFFCLVSENWNVFA